MNNPVFAAMRDVIEKDPDTDTLSKLEKLKQIYSSLQ